MITNEDIREFELIERPVSPNKHDNSSSTIVKMWVFLEGSLRAKKLSADTSEIKDLDDFISVLKDEFKTKLKNVGLEDIVLLDKNNIPLLPDTELQPLAEKSTGKNPLIVRYPLSNVNLNVTLSYGPNNNQSKQDLAHTSGAFSLLIGIAKNVFKLVEETEIYFVNDKTEIKDAYKFNILVNQTKLDNNNNCMLRLKIVEKNKKSFSHWDFNSVFKDIFGKPNIRSLSDMKRMNMTEFPPLDKPFTEEELSVFTGELKSTVISLKREFDNESKCRIYINAFLKAAVFYVHKNISTHVWLDVEGYLNGKYGYGPADYLMMFGRIIAMVCEAKKESIRQAVAQVVVQIRSVIEQMVKLLDKKRSLDTMKLPPIFGIVTTGGDWRFVRWTGLLEEPVIHISEPYTCDFGENMNNEIKVLTFITQILKYQVHEFTRYNSMDGDHLPKRLCTDD